LARIVGSQLRAPREQFGARRLPYVPGEHVAVEGLVVAVEDQPAGTIPVELEVASKLGRKRRGYRHPPRLGQVAVFEGPPLRILVGVEPSFPCRSVIAPNDQPPRPVAGRQFDVLAQQAGGLTGPQAA